MAETRKTRLYLHCLCACSYVQDVKPHDEVSSDTKIPLLHLTFIIIVCYSLILERKTLFTLLYCILSYIIFTLCQDPVVQLQANPDMNKRLYYAQCFIIFDNFCMQENLNLCMSINNLFCPYSLHRSSIVVTSQVYGKCIFIMPISLLANEQLLSGVHSPLVIYVTKNPTPGCAPGPFFLHIRTLVIRRGKDVLVYRAILSSIKTEASLTNNPAMGEVSVTVVYTYTSLNR